MSDHEFQLRNSAHQIRIHHWVGTERQRKPTPQIPTPSLPVSDTPKSYGMYYFQGLRHDAIRNKYRPCLSVFVDILQLIGPELVFLTFIYFIVRSR